MMRPLWNRLVGRRPYATVQSQGHRLRLEPLEERCQPSVTGFRPIDEVGNNQATPLLGTAGTDLLRLSPAAYADNMNSPSLPNNPSARVISDILNVQADPANPLQDIQTVDQNSLTDFGYVWGQFIDHDMDLTPGGSGQLDNILADPADPSQMGTQTFVRSSFDPSTGTSPSNPRQQINAITSFLDLSQVYGSNATVASALRTGSGGLMKTSPGNLLPFNSTAINPLTGQPYFSAAQLQALNMANDAQAVPSTSLFAAGDVRANENIELTALQTLFVRNHNAIATQLAQEDPTLFGFTSWTDENLYQEARKINIAVEQNITYTAFLPALLGSDAAPDYTGYNPNVDPAIATEFSTVAFRFGHSLLSNAIQRHGNDGADIPGDPTGSAAINLAQDFFNPTLLNANGGIDPLTNRIRSDIGPILKGDADGNSQAMDVMAINEVRNLLFANGGLQDNGQDLMARDVQRARDDGIGTYNQLRVAFGLPKVGSFADITSNVTVQQELQKAYGTVDNIDPFEGGLAEDHMAGSDMGPLFTKILSDQFTRLMAGDRFFYLNETWTPAELNLLAQGNTLAKVIEANTPVTNLQSDVFVFRSSISGTVLFDPTGTGTLSTQDPGIPGVKVELLDTSGDILATTTTNFLGQFRFTQLSGPSNNVEAAPGVSATGTYQLALVLPSYLTQTTATPSPVTITHGGTRVTGQNFGVDFTSFVGQARDTSLANYIAEILEATEDTGSAPATTALWAQIVAYVNSHT
jgi:hypothetical protein